MQKRRNSMQYLHRLTEYVHYEPTVALALG